MLHALYTIPNKMFHVRDIPKTPGERLKEIREALDISARKAERLSDPRVTHSNIGKIESGETPWEAVKLSTIRGLARAYGRTPEQLMKEVEGHNSDETALTPHTSLTNSSDVNNPMFGRRALDRLIPSARVHDGGMRVPDFALVGFNLTGCTGLSIEDDVLLCERAFIKYERHHSLIISGKEQPEKESDYLVYRFLIGQYQDCFVILRRLAPGEMQLIKNLEGQSVEAVRRDDPRLEYLGVVVASWENRRQ